MTQPTREGDTTFIVYPMDDGFEDIWYEDEAAGQQIEWIAEPANLIAKTNE